VNRVDWPAVRAGAIVAIAVCLPISVLGNVLIDDPEHSSATTLVFAAVVVGFAIGGFAAASRSSEMPYSTGAIAALTAFVLIEIVVVIARVIRDDDIQVTVIVANAFFAYGAGLLGGALASRRAAR
jgi:putative membrane protein (TIGR04086 family)